VHDLMNADHVLMSEKSVEIVSEWLAPKTSIKAQGSSTKKGDK
jgi:hypothetical protein